MNSIPSKQCATCQQVRPTTEFHRSKQQKDGLSVYCRGCANARSLAGYYKHRAERIASVRAYYERTHDQQTEAQLTLRRERERRYRSHTQAQRAALVKAWREQHRDEVRAYQRRWVDEHRDQVRETIRRRVARQRNATIVRFTTEQLEAKLAYWGHRCWMCGVPATCIDHVKPLAKGGAHALCNLRPACQPCNQSKKDAWPLARLL